MSEPKHLKFVEAPPAPKTRRVWVVNKHDDTCLGNIGWFGRWRRYAFYPNDGTLFEQDCMRDIANYIEEMTKQHREKAPVTREAQSESIV